MLTNQEFWENDLEIAASHLLKTFQNPEVQKLWLDSLSGKQLSIIFQNCPKCQVNGQLFNDESYDNISAQQKRKILANYLEDLFDYYLISHFDRAKLEFSVSEIAKVALTEKLITSYLVKGNDKYDKRSLLFLLFHQDRNLLTSVYHFDKIQRKGFILFALQKAPRQLSTPFKEFISKSTIIQLLKEDQDDDFENQLKGFFLHQERIYVLIRRASNIDLLLNSNKAIHGHKPDWIILDFLCNGTQVNLSAKDINKAVEIANGIASNYFNCECVFINVQDQNFAAQVYKFLQTCIDGSDPNIFTFELRFKSDRCEYRNTLITLTVALHDPIASELHILHPCVGDILKSIESMKIIFQGKKIGLSFKSRGEYIAVYYSEHPLNKKEKEAFKGYLTESYGLTILSKANI